MERNAMIDPEVPSRPARILAVLLLTLAAAVLGGCASAGLQGGPDWPSEASLSAADPLYDEALKKYQAEDAGPLRRKRVRNDFIEIRAGLIDRGYSSFRSTVWSQRVRSAVGTELATLGLGALGAGIADVGTKTATNALSALIGGARTSVEKNAFVEQTMPALLAQMDARRAEVRERLLAGMMVDVERYPIVQAAADLDDYFHAGTLASAIGALTAQAGTQKAAAERSLQSRLPSAGEVREELERRGFDIQDTAQTPTNKLLAECLTRSRKEGRRDLDEAIRSFVLTDPDFRPDPMWLSKFLTLRANEPMRQRFVDAPASAELLKPCRMSQP